MSRFLLSALSIFVLVGSSLLLPGNASARRCPVRDPETLLSLYRNSEFIYIGTFDKTEDGAPTEDTAEYTVIPIKKYFTISSSLKGEPRKFVVLEDTEYRYKNEEQSPAEAEQNAEADAEDAASAEAEEEGDNSNEAEEGDEVVTFINGHPFRPLKEGDSVILFLDRAGADDVDSEQEERSGTENKTDANEAKEEDRLELSDEPYGLKNLTPDALSAYETRIKELNGIFASKNPTHSEIVAWIIRTAEDPLTRWEGTFELVRSFQRMEWLEERAKAEKEQDDTEGVAFSGAQAGEPETAGEDEEADEAEEASEKFSTGDPGFAKAVSDAQKQALTNILLSRGKSTTQERTSLANGFVHGDRELIDLVGRWGNSAVAENLVEQVIKQSDAELTSDLMATISSILKDDELSSISERYSNIRWREDSEEVEDETVDEAEQSDATSNDEQAAAVPPVESADETSDQESDDATENKVEEEAIVAPKAASAESKKQTYGELRAELLGEFKARASELMTKERDKKTAKLDH